MNNNNNNRKNIVPVVSYFNLDTNKSIIYKENKGKSGIYRLNNIITNKSYVGSSINLGKRLSMYYSKKAMLNKISSGTSIIYSALLKHSNDNFTLDILEYCEINVLIEREQYYMDLLKPEYNILEAANSRIGSKHSLKARALMSIKQRGINNPSFGKRPSQETRNKIKESLKSYWLNVEVKPIIKGNIKPKTPETILKMSLRTQGVSVNIYNKSGYLVKVFPTIVSAAKYFDVSSTTIGRIPHNGTYDNFTFEFEVKDIRIWVYNLNKELVKILDNSNETSKCYNIARSTLNTYIRSGKLYNNKFYFYKISSKNNPYFNKKN